MNRRMPNGTSGGVGGRQGDPASYPIHLSGFTGTYISFTPSTNAFSLRLRLG